MANGHGGARPGAGRKRKAEKYEARINKAEKRIADRLPEMAEKIIELAFGKVAAIDFDDDRSAAQRAGLHQAIHEQLRGRADEIGQWADELADDFGKLPDECRRLIAEMASAMLKSLGVEPGEFVYRIPPNAKMLQYGVDRIAGKATQKVEVEWSQERVENLFASACERVAEVLDERLDPETAEACKRSIFERIQQDLNSMQG